MLSNPTNPDKKKLLNCSSVTDPYLFKYSYKESFTPVQIFLKPNVCFQQHKESLQQAEVQGASYILQYLPQN